MPTPFVRRETLVRVSRLSGFGLNYICNALRLFYTESNREC